MGGQKRSNLSLNLNYDVLEFLQRNKKVKISAVARSTLYLLWGGGGDTRVYKIGSTTVAYIVQLLYTVVNMTKLVYTVVYIAQLVCKIVHVNACSLCKCIKCVWCARKAHRFM